MKVTKEKSEFGLKVFLEEDGKCIAFTFGGNLDLYWYIHDKRYDKNKEDNYSYFIITKENYAIYSLFEQLFFDIENINIFDSEYDIPFYIETEEDMRLYLEEQEKSREEDKEKYRLFNHSNYNELFNKDDKTITWYSDETAHDVANILKIKKDKNSFKLEFYIQPHVDGYDEDFHLPNYIPIRFRNSGSSYDPFNVVFMRMYNNMKDIDDVNDYGHQIHIEEYMFNKENKLVKRK